MMNFLVPLIDMLIMMMKMCSINVEVSAGYETNDGSSNPPAPPSNNFVFGYNIEQPLSFGDEFDQV